MSHVKHVKYDDFLESTGLSELERDVMWGLFANACRTVTKFTPGLLTIGSLVAPLTNILVSMGFKSGDMNMLVMSFQNGEFHFPFAHMTVSNGVITALTIRDDEFHTPGSGSYA